jgi:hypothetical protein
MADRSASSDLHAHGPGRLRYYSLVALVGMRNPGSPLLHPVLFDISNQTLDSTWVQRSLDAAIRSNFFHKGDVLVFGTKVLKGWDPVTAGSPLDEYLWNAIDPRDGQPLRLCLLWMPSSSSSSSSLFSASAGSDIDSRLAKSPSSLPHIYGDPVKLLFVYLLQQLHRYPLSRIKRPVTNPHVTAVVASDLLSTITNDQVRGWYDQCGFASRGC